MSFVKSMKSTQSPRKSFAKQGVDTLLETLERPSVVVAPSTRMVETSDTARSTDLGPQLRANLIRNVNTPQQRVPGKRAYWEM